MTGESAIPKYSRIKRDLRHKIQSGALAPGDVIPGEVALAAEYGVSRTSTRLALRDLAMDGLVIRSRGGGTRVAGPVARARHRLRSQCEMFGFVLPAALPVPACSVFQSFASDAAQRGYATTGLSSAAIAAEMPDTRWAPDLFSGIVQWDSADGPGGWRSAPLVRVLSSTSSMCNESDTVVLPHVEAAKALANEVARQGHRSVGIVVDAGASGDACAAACQRALRRSGSVACTIIRIDPAFASDPVAVAMRLLAQPRRPTAILSTRDGFTARLVGGLRRLGYRGADDLTLATIDMARGDEHVPVERWPRIRAVFSPEDVAAACLYLLLRRMEQTDAAWETVHVQAALEVGSSVIHRLPQSRSEPSIARAAGQR